VCPILWIFKLGLHRVFFWLDSRGLNSPDAEVRIKTAWRMLGYKNVITWNGEDTPYPYPPFVKAGGRILGLLIEAFKDEKTKLEHDPNYENDFKLCHETICFILKENPSSASESDLRKLAALLKAHWTETHYESACDMELRPGGYEIHTITTEKEYSYECDTACDLAQKELSRRGLKV
jgi:hypothetical protein